MGASESEAFPTPTSYLLGCEYVSQRVDLKLAPLLTPEEYEDARSNAMLCNLSLRTASADAAELESFGAALPAADACHFSSVIKARLQRWPKTTGEERTVLELQIGVRQEILDRLVRAIYDRKLLIDTSSAESFLLLADYLQMEWLTKAVAFFAENSLLAKPSLAVCKLAAAQPCLGIFDRAAAALMAAAPPTETLLDLILMSDETQRTTLLKEAAKIPDAGHRMKYLVTLARHPDADLTQEEALLLAASGANLQVSGAQLCNPGKLTNPHDRHFQMSSMISGGKVWIGIAPTAANEPLRKGDSFHIFPAGSNTQVSQSPQISWVTTQSTNGANIYNHAGLQVNVQ